MVLFLSFLSSCITLGKDFPHSNVKSIKAGKTNKEIFLTTARSKMQTNEIAKYPLSGGLFKILTNVKGKKTRSYKQSILKL